MQSTRTVARARRAAFASFLGGTLEYYDFFVYTTAASLIFGRVFFPAGDPTAALIQSFAVLGVGYVFRPIGAFIFGHLGDRVSRKNTLVATLTIMGASTFLIGVLPTFQTAGYLAPILLVVLRILQGLSAGGETAGASTLTVEESPEGRRAFYASFTSSGISAGIVLASLVFLPVAALPEAARDSWGWRVPFLLSVVVLIVAYLVRRRLEEPEVFVDEKDAHRRARLPMVGLFRSNPKAFLVVVLMSLVIVITTFMQSFGLAYATQISTLSPADMLWTSVAGNVLAVVWGQPVHRRGPGDIAELESGHSDDWGPRALLACLRKLCGGGPTEAERVVVEDAWATNDEFRVIYSWTGGRRVGIIRNRETTIDRMDVYATGDIATPEEFGQEVADFNIGEPWGRTATSSMLMPTVSGGGATSPFAAARDRPLMDRSSDTSSVVQRAYPRRWCCASASDRQGATAAEGVVDAGSGLWSSWCREVDAVCCYRGADALADAPRRRDRGRDVEVPNPTRAVRYRCVLDHACHRGTEPPSRSGGHRGRGERR